MDILVSAQQRAMKMRNLSYKERLSELGLEKAQVVGNLSPRRCWEKNGAMLLSVVLYTRASTLSTVFLFERSVML